MTLRIIAGTPPGGGQDRAARAFALVLDEETEVINVPGRGGGNGWDLLVSSPAEAGLVAVSSPTLVTNAILGEATIDHRDLTPLAMLYTEFSALVVRQGSPLDDPGALLDRLAGGAPTVSFATAVGSINHMILAEIASHLGIDVSSIPIRVFESAPLALADLTAGNCDIAMVSAVSASSGIDEGTLTPVLVTAPERIGGVFSETPTCVESSVPCVRGIWRGLVGPPGIDRATVAIWADRVAAVTGSERWCDVLCENLWIASRLRPADTDPFLEQERHGLLRLLRQVGLWTEGSDG
jgi:putative tricarboxylic transport membrane protein